MKKSALILTVSILAVVLIAIAGTAIYRYANAEASGDDYPPLKEEYAKLYQQMLGNDSTLMLEGTILLYDSESPGTVKENTPFSFSKNGQSFIYELGPMQTICNGSLFLQLDTANQYLVVSGLTDSLQQQALSSVMPMQLDALFSDTAAFKTTGKIGGNDKERFMELSSEMMPEIQKTTVYYNPATYRITHTEIVWWKNNMMLTEEKNTGTWITKIKYSYPSYKAPDADGRINKIITIKNNTVEPVAEYADYTFNSSL